MKLISNQTLQIMTEQLSQTFFKRPFKHQIQFNSRLKTTGGRYFVQSHNIDMNPRTLLNFDNMDVLVGAIKHELTHYHLDIAGKNANHNSAEFKGMLRHVGGLKFAPHQLVETYAYECVECGNRFAKPTHLDLNRYQCAKCLGKLRYLGEKHPN